MRWKWYTLRILSMLLCLCAAVPLALLLLRVAVKPAILTVTAELLTLLTLLLFAAISTWYAWAQWQSTGSLLGASQAALPKVWWRSKGGLVAGLLLVVVWVMLSVTLLSALYKLGLANARRQEPGLLPTVWATGTIAVLCVVSYLLAINTYFEISHRRRMAEEDLVSGIGHQLSSH